MPRDDYEYGYDAYRDVGARRAPNTGRPIPKRRKKKKKKSSTLFISMCLLLIAGAALLLYNYIYEKKQSTVKTVITPITTDCVYQNTGDGLLYQTEGQIHFYHLTDQKQNYTYGHAASSIRMSGSSDMTVVFNEGSLQIIGVGSTMEPPAGKGTISEVECGTSYAAVLMEDGAGRQSLAVLNRSYDIVSMIDFSEDQYVQDFGFYKMNGEKLWIELLSVNYGIPTTQIKAYDIAKQADSGIMQVRDQLVDEVFVTADSIFAAGTDQIIRYTHDNKEMYRETVYGYEVIDYTLANSPTFLLVPRGGDMHSVKMLTLSESAESNVSETHLQLPTEGVAACMMNGSLVVVSRENLYVYSLKGKLTREASVDVPVDDAVKLTEKTLMIASNGTYYLANIG